MPRFRIEYHQDVTRYVTEYRCCEIIAPCAESARHHFNTEGPGDFDDFHDEETNDAEHGDMDIDRVREIPQVPS